VAAKEVEDLLLYFKEKFQECGKALVLRDVHHDECARRLNEKYGTSQENKSTTSTTSSRENGR
jgi:hypothetical protein